MREQLALLDQAPPPNAPERPERPLSARTIASYELDVLDFERFAAGERDGRPRRHADGSTYPAKAEWIVDYLHQLDGEGRRMSTLQRRLAALRWRHERAELPSPTGSGLVQAVWKAILDQHGGMQKERPLAVVERDIAALVEPIGTATADLRDRALVLVSYRGGLSAGELAAMHIEDVEIGPDLMVIQVRQPRLFGRRRKPRQPESGTVRIHRAPNAKTCALAAYTAWIERLEHPNAGPVFRSFISNGELAREAGLDRQRIHELIQARFQAAGLVGANGRAFTVESLRYAKIAQAGLEGAKPLHQVLADEGYTSSNNRAVEIYKSASQRRTDRTIPVGI